MKGIDVQLASSTTAAAANNIIFDTATGVHTNGSELEAIHHLRTRMQDMFQLPSALANNDKKRILDELFEGTPACVVDYCDNEQQIEVLRHHYLNEFAAASGSQQQHQEAEVGKDYRDDSVIHKVVDDTPSTYRGRHGAVDAWHDLSAYLHGPCKFDVTHISVCRNHAQVNWKAECSSPENSNNNNNNNKHTALVGTDSFTFDDSNHIKMQTTVALSETEESPN